MAFNLTPPAIKSILSSLGYKNIQNDPPFGKPKGFNVLVKTPKDVLNFIKIVLPVLKSFGTKLKDIPYEGPYRPEYSYIEVNGFAIFAKLEKEKVIHPNLSYGRENEQNLFNTIEEYLDAYKYNNIEFQENGRTQFLVKSVTGIEKTGTKTEGRRKADIELRTAAGKKVPISLKQTDAPGWESPETYWGEHARNMLEYALVNYPNEIKLKSKNGIMSLNREIALEANSNEAKDLVFGSDIYQNGAVIKQTWKSGHFDWDGNFKTLTMDCHAVIRDIHDIDSEDYPHFQIRNFENKNPKYLYPGLSILAVTKKATKNSKILPATARNYQGWKDAAA